MKFEKSKEPLASSQKYRKRLTKYFLFSGGLLIFSLVLGTIGYWYFGQQNSHYEKPSWIDAFLTASMILTGMGPVGTIESDAGKIFSALYALYSGIAFLTSAAIFFSPIIHRFLHLMHMDMKDED
jgi:FtsH-binding integral membrane protein